LVTLTRVTVPSTRGFAISPPFSVQHDPVSDQIAADGSAAEGGSQRFGTSALSGSRMCGERRLVRATTRAGTAAHRLARLIENEWQDGDRGQGVGSTDLPQGVNGKARKGNQREVGAQGGLSGVGAHGRTSRHSGEPALLLGQPWHDDAGPGQHGNSQVTRPRFRVAEQARRDTTATKPASTSSNAPVRRPAMRSEFSDGARRKRQSTIVADSSMAPSPPKAASAGLQACHAAPSDTVASTTIHAMVIC